MDIPIVPVFSSTTFVGVAAIFILIVIEEVVEVDVAISMSIFFWSDCPNLKGKMAAGSKEYTGGGLGSDQRVQ